MTTPMLWEITMVSSALDGLTISATGSSGVPGILADNLVEGNVATVNGGDGYQADTDIGSNLFRNNRSNANGGYGYNNVSGPNTYQKNQCQFNALGGSSPAGLCETNLDIDGVHIGGQEFVCAVTGFSGTILEITVQYDGGLASWGFSGDVHSVDLISNDFTGGTPDPVTFTFSRRNQNWAPHVPMEFESLAGDSFQCVVDRNTAVIS